MKKLIFCFVCTLCCSCAITTPTTTTLVGDVTAYTQTGEVLQKWNQVVLQEETYGYGYTNTNAFKTFGLNFYDKKSGKHIIIGNAVPYIIEYSTKSSKSSYSSQNTDTTYSSSSSNSGNSGKEKATTGQINNEEYKNKLINQWRELSEKEKSLRAELKKADKNSVEYQNLKNQHKGITLQMNSISNKLWSIFGYDIFLRGF